MKNLISGLFIISTICVSTLLGKISVRDPAIEMLTVFQLAQVVEEVRDAESKVKKYSEYLGVSRDELREIRESLGPWTIHSDYVSDVQWLRDRYLRILSYLDREQQSKFKQLYFLESPTESLLITPTVQNVLKLTEEQKKKLEKIYLETIKDHEIKDIKKNTVVENSNLGADRMMELLTKQQMWKLKHSRENIEYKVARQANPSALIEPPPSLFER